MPRPSRRWTGEAPAETRGEPDSPASGEKKGHGHNGADDFTGAEKIEVRHESLQPGDPCPKCEQGTLYDTRRPGVLVRLVGQAPVKAMVYYLQKLRCNPCGAIFTAKPPEGVIAEEKYDPTVGSMIALLKYGYGMPFHRQETLQGNLGIPLPDATQWDIVDAQAERAEPVWQELVRQAAQGEVVHNDDTGVKILELMAERSRQAALEDSDAGTAAQPGSARKLCRSPCGRLRRRLGEGAGAGSHGDVHHGDRGDAARRRAPGAQDRVVPQRASARRRELEGRAASACCGTASADPDEGKAATQGNPDAVSGAFPTTEFVGYPL